MYYICIYVYVYIYKYTLHKGPTPVLDTSNHGRGSPWWSRWWRQCGKYFFAAHTDSSFVYNHFMRESPPCRMYVNIHTYREGWGVKREIHIYIYTYIHIYIHI